ncbi:ABC transporter substrate-binding protein [Paenibacillus methanolicus]|uniref:MarR-like DNA-binding transcriptional regulator SgrR of sgrS sRNA n=1 Tax=Paenibacillus methanolicus TaxID=582686 RepID=A0A5S5CG22_9BACL|nr:ABC transporter substrate-binding protein [Paenibacillus methanolicus]TYP78237.1 MarR-like DNA-binding transcriptional regulator SgrR of sgrS sRNA [Paenibacillus methanolicus]
MQLLTTERYLTLFNRFSPGSAAGMPIEATLDEVAETLFCTARNARLIVRKLEEEGLIEWRPGLGRGNRSQIVFRRDQEAYLLEIARGQAESGDYKQAFDLLETHGQGAETRESFLAWLNGQFGYRKEARGEGGRAMDALVFPINQQTSTLDPAELYYAMDAQIIRQVFDRLLHFDADGRRIVGGLAHHWTSGADATEWTFYLRKGVRFHDGRELTSADVRYTFERLRGATSNRWLMRGVAAIETAGTLVVRFRLHRPNRIFDRFVCSAAASIVQDGSGGTLGGGEWRGQPAGTGPFRLAPGTPFRIRLEANPDYFHGRPYLDRVDMIVMPDYCRSESFGVPADRHGADADPYSEATDDWQNIEQLCRGSTMLSMNLGRSGPQRSERFRQAVRMILDAGALIAEIGGDRAMPAYGFCPETSSAYEPTAYGEADIRAALQGAGYDGEPFRLSIHEKHRGDARWICDRLGRWGIRTELVVPSGGICGALDEGADGTLMNIVLAEDEVCEIETYEHESATLKRYLDPERMAWINGRIDEALAADTPDARRRIFRDIEGRLREEACVVFLYHRRLNTLLHPSVRGVVRLNALGWIDFKDVWMEQAE